MIRLTLPYPPSVNRIWRRSKFSTYLSEVGKIFYAKVRPIIFCATNGKKIFCADCRVAVTVSVYPPDKRKRDLDNVLKTTLDALTRCGVWDDDSQVDCITVMRRYCVKGGKVEVTAEDLHVS